MTTAETYAFLGLVFLTGVAVGAGIAFILVRGRTHA